MQIFASLKILKMCFRQGLWNSRFINFLSNQINVRVIKFVAISHSPCLGNVFFSSYFDIIKAAVDYVHHNKVPATRTLEPLVPRHRVPGSDSPETAPSFSFLTLLPPLNQFSLIQIFK